MKIDTSFIRIGAEWPVDHALAVLEAFPKVNRVVVHRVDHKGEFFYAYDYGEIRQRLDARGAGTVFDALDLHEWKATPTVPADGRDPGVNAVALDRGRIVGVVQRGHTASAPIAPITDLRGDDEVLRGDDENVRGTPLPGIGVPATPRTLSALIPPSIEKGATKSLLIKLSKGAIGGDGSTIAAAAGDEIDVVLEVSSTLEIVGSAEGTLKVDGSDEIALQFKIRGSALGDGRITVYAFKGGSSVAKLSVSTLVIDTAPAVSTPIERRAEIRAVDTPPDLAVEIYEDKRNRSYTIRLTTGDSALGLNRAKFGPIQLDEDVDAFFTTFYSDIESILASTDSASDKIAKLGQKGVYLFERIVPADMRARLWELRDKIQSVQIQSEEPWVPWELCRLTGRDASGKILNGVFISEQYEVTRWFLGMPQHRTLTFDSIGLVVPPSNLRAAPAERVAINALASDKRKVIEIKPSASALRSELASASYDALHFVGHGAFSSTNADRSSIKLEDDQRFLPEDLAGEVANLGLKRPIVFLNACEVGRAGTTLGGTAGWPQGFINAGAGAFIGPFWKIGDASSSQFAREFYAHLLTGATIGQAVHHARTVIRKASDPTWLAYVAYAHPDAKIQ